MLALVAVLVVIILLMLFIFGLTQSVKNRAVSLEESVKTAESDIRVQEKRRVDLVYNLVDCVKNYDAHEAEVLTKLAESMGHANADTTELRAVLNATAYQYPELTSNDLYKELMNELSMTENLISRHRENYNESVQDYARYTRQFPASMVLPIAGYKRQEYKYLDYQAPSDAPQNLFGDKK